MLNKFLLSIFFSLLLQPLLIYSKGGGGGSDSGSSSSPSSYGGSSSSSSSSYTSSAWVFWYYDGSGRHCGNYCIVIFSIVGALIFFIIACGIWRCYMIKQFYKDDRIHNDYESAFEDFTRENEIATNNHNRTQIEMQYPPLSQTTTIVPITDPPPAYDATYGEESHKHGLRHDATYEKYKAGRQYTREHPPHEVLPPKEHIAFILSNRGPKAWEMVINHNGQDGSSTSNEPVSVSDRGRTVTFHGKDDTMVQANYPLFKPQLDGDDDSLRLSSNIVTSEISKNVLSKSSDLPPNYEQSHLSEKNVISSSNWNQDWFYYFEITIISNPNKRDSTLAIGLTTKPYPSFRLPGWNKHSVGYHSDDGCKFNNDGLGGRNYGERWGDDGDTIGCGYYPETGIVFFTKNGKSQGNAFSGLKHIWFPTVGADNKCKIEVNFGDGEKEFRYEEAREMSVAGPINLPSNG